ncbi:MAG TPA: MATE family efflux transporter, partial [Caulobacteraceae bacterium]
MTMTAQTTSQMNQRWIDGAYSAMSTAWPVARLAGPLAALFSIQSLGAVATLAVIGRLGEAQLAGVGAANAIFGLALALTFGVDTAVQARTARAVGASRPEALGQVLIDGLAVSAPLGAVLAVALWAFGPWFVAALLPDPAAKAAGGAFLRAIAPSLVLYAVTIPMNALWIGSGRPGVALLVTALTAPVQVGGAATMALGLGLGAAGAGWAVVLAMACAVALQFFLALRTRPIAGFARAEPSLAGVRAT